jgi:cell pole-organizing protein PopZ
MADPKTEQEPSIEEILQSIRQIISEDGSEKAKPETTTLTMAPEPVDKGGNVDLSVKADTDMGGDDDVLELTDIVEPDDGREVDLRPVEQEPEQSSIGAMPMTDTDSSDLDLSSNDKGLLSDSASAAAASAMSKLLAGNVAVEREEVGRVGNVTLEDMTRELMRPLIKTWLDQNLPRIVEKMVAKELEKVSRRAMK